MIFFSETSQFWNYLKRNETFSQRDEEDWSEEIFFFAIFNRLERQSNVKRERAN